jgi:hypothetical protein
MKINGDLWAALSAMAALAVVIILVSVSVFPPEHAENYEWKQPTDRSATLVKILYDRPQ